MPASKKINLLPEDEFEASGLGKLLKWAMSVGRYIVIGTELVVIGSFLTRFSLDRQVTDLNEAIAQKQALIASYGDLEEEVRAVQDRISLVTTLNNQTLGVKEILDRIVNFTPIDVAYTKLTLSGDQMLFSGQAFSDAGLQTLLSLLRQQTAFNKVVVQRLAAKASGEIEFDISITTKGAVPTRQRGGT